MVQNHCTQHTNIHCVFSETKRSIELWFLKTQQLNVELHSTARMYVVGHKEHKFIRGDIFTCRVMNNSK
jgi:hypothetical protein